MVGFPLMVPILANKVKKCLEFVTTSWSSYKMHKSPKTDYWEVLKVPNTVYQ